ncbi:T6SS immunity protein Tdi1 domain-containing protein [Nocardia sp. NPDC050713]|uniref:T6SS immunity protein Tdi1 domain-containing protein n=1 Tax=unclassified Nocardia TaxID=2637762 RepID=UPI0033A37C5C
MTVEGFQLIGQRPVVEAMPAWAPHFPQFDLVFGYSDLGHTFLVNSQSGECAVLHPYRAAAKGYGAFADPAEFADRVLREQGFADYVLRTEHVARIRDLLGPLAPEQVYIATPYPFLGGSEAPETYDTGELWTFLELVAQAQQLQ